MWFKVKRNRDVSKIQRRTRQYLRVSSKPRAPSEYLERTRAPSVGIDVIVYSLWVCEYVSISYIN